MRNDCDDAGVHARGAPRVGHVHPTRGAPPTWDATGAHMAVRDLNPVHLESHQVVCRMVASPAAALRGGRRTTSETATGGATTAIGMTTGTGSAAGTATVIDTSALVSSGFAHSWPCGCMARCSAQVAAAGAVLLLRPAATASVSLQGTIFCAVEMRAGRISRFRG